MLSSGSGQRVATVFGLVLFATGWVAPSPRGLAQDAAPRDKEARGKWFPLFQRHAGEYVVRVGQDARHEARMLPEPVLRWSQPVRGGDDGALYLWVRQGQPVAVVSFFTYKWPSGLRVILHEQHSLATEPVEATWRQDVGWKASRPGVAFKPIPGAPSPADTAPARLRQMQALVREFSANTVDDKGATWPLRPLIKPLYRYEAKDDGALFAMVQGTDPEAFILIESRGEGNAAHWESAFARFTDLELHVRLDGREVFSGVHTLGAANEIYHSHDVIKKTSDSPKDFH
jgi:hypothetical protein